MSSSIERVTGRAVAVRGDDIDTDRIIPARFLKTITFDGLEDHLFEDDRRELAGQGQQHPIDAPAHKGAKILLVQGTHAITVDYFQSTGQVALQVFCKKAGGAEQICPTRL